MSTELAVREEVNVSDLRQTAQLLALSGYFDAKGTAEQAVAQLATKILAGREMGFGPYASVNGIHIISGKPTVSANLMAAAVKSSDRYDYRVRKMDDDAVAIEFFQVAGGKLESLGVSTFTKADATKAGTQNLAKFARNMLFARAMSNGVRWYCPDVFMAGSVYTPEEMGATVDVETGEIIEAEVRPVNPLTADVQFKPKPAEVPAWQTWAMPADAYAWFADAFETDTAEAEAVFKEMVANQFGGKFTVGNKARVFETYYNTEKEVAPEPEPVTA